MRRLAVFAALMIAAGSALAQAGKVQVKPAHVIPMHYGANPLGKGTRQEYLQALGSAPTRVHALKPGEKVEF